ncbi:MAG: hypothetical protein ABW187_04915 [Dokdonella sp.]
MKRILTLLLAVPVLATATTIGFDEARWSALASSAATPPTTAKPTKVDRIEGTAGIRFFTDQPSFDAAIESPASLAQEGFDGGLPISAPTVCSEPLDSASRDSCFVPGDLIGGFALTSSSGGGAILLPAGLLGPAQSSPIVGANAFADTTVVTLNPSVTATSFHVYTAPVRTVELEAFAADGSLLGASSVTPAATDVPAFFGVVSSMPVSRITLAAESGSGELIDDLRFGAAGAAAPSVSKAFAPAAIQAGTPSTLTITLTNSQASPATLTSALTDPFPSGMTLATPANAATTCGANLDTTAAAITLAAGATIPASASCTIVADVTVATGTYVNTIAAGALQTDLGSNTGAASASLTASVDGRNGIILSPPLGRFIRQGGQGTSMNIVQSTFDDSGPISGNWDFNFHGSPLESYAIADNAGAYAIGDDGNVRVMRPGDIVGPDLQFADASSSFTVPYAAEWLAGTDAYVGVRFACAGRLTFPPAAPVCYGYVHLTTQPPRAFPARVIDTGFNGDGDPITIAIGGGGNAPSASASPASLAMTATTTAKATALVNVMNAVGSDPLHFSIESRAAGTDGPCTGSAADWLTIAPVSGYVNSGESADVIVTADPLAGRLNEGTYAADVCITNDATNALTSVPVTLVVAADRSACSATDDIFCDGFDGAAGGAHSFDTRDAFLAAVAPGSFTNAFDDVVLGPSAALSYSDPVSGIAYTVDSRPTPNLLFNYDGYLSTNTTTLQLVVTFTGAPVTAIGADAFTLDFDGSPSATVGSQVTVTLSDGTIRTFTVTDTDQGPFFFGFTTAGSIARVTIEAPDDPVNAWPGLDNLTVGTAR